MYNVAIPPIQISVGGITVELKNDSDAYAYLNAVANNSPSTDRWRNGYTFDEKVPASEWNWTFGQMTRLMFRMRYDLYSATQEIMHLIKDKIPDATFSDTNDVNMSANNANHQLLDAVDIAIFTDRKIIAGTQTDNPAQYKSPLGSVTTSSLSGKVAVDPSTGVMTVNGMGDVAGVGNIVNPNALTSITAILANIMNVIYPVGTIYTSTSLTTPAQVAAKFGGTWEAYGKGRVLVGAGSGTDPNGTTQSFTAGSTGGYYSVKLTADKLPAHYHGKGNQNITGNFTARGLTDGAPGIQANGAFFAQSNVFSMGKVDTTMDDDNPPGTFGFNANRSGAWTGRTDGGYTAQTNGTALAGAAHENKQPYVVVYMYRRTA